MAVDVWTAVWVDEFGNFTQRAYSRCGSVDVAAAQVAKEIRGMPRREPLLFRGEAVELASVRAYVRGLRDMVET